MTIVSEGLNTNHPTIVREAEITAVTKRRVVGRQRLLALALQVAFLALLLGSWQAVVELGWIKPLFVSRPTSIARALYDLLVHGDMLSALQTTLYETAVGFIVSVFAGGISALVLLETPLLQRASSPFITAANNLPRLALAPLFVLWFGIGSAARIGLVITIVYFVILINTYAGLQTTDRDHLILARVVGASRLQTFFRFRLPAALPTIFAGFQLGLTYAFLGAVIAEMLSGGSGLGAQISTFLAVYNTAAVFADLFLMAFVATVLSGAMRVVERAVLSWRQHEMRGLATSGTR